MLCIRQGPWKLIPQLGSGGFTKPSKVKPAPGEPPGQLYNLADDPGEQRNRYMRRIRRSSQRLTALLEKGPERKAQRAMKCIPRLDND